MNRLLILTVAVLLAALALPASPAGAQAPSIVRGAVLQVTRKTTPSRDRSRPYTFTTRGRIVPPSTYCAPGAPPALPGRNCIPILCPPGATNIAYCFVPGRSVICSGKVNVRYQKKGTTISSRTVSVRPDCTYRSRVAFHTRLITRIGLLRVRARFEGNVILLPRTSTTGSVRAG